VESVAVLSSDPFLGLGLASAAQTALTEAGLAMHEISLRISDVSGEQYAFKEQGLAVARLLKVPVESIPIWHWADCIGDVGAAAAVAQLVLYFCARMRGYGPEGHALCFASAVLGGRAAAVLSDLASGDGDVGA
jgi:3-oxoacyl-[acyl-carrier-protein] synthase I